MSENSAVEFGICTDLSKAGVLKALGWDFIEVNAQQFFQGLVSDDTFIGLKALKVSPLPVAAANCLVPGDMKLVGPAVDWAKLEQYMTRVCARAGEAGVGVLVLGSGAARRVPDGFSPAEARDQITRFGQMAASAAACHHVVVVLEPLCRRECNIVNSVTEALSYVQSVNHPHFQCLLDTYHFWMENEPVDHLSAAAPWIKHVHVADLQGRVAPGRSGQADYRRLFGILQQAGYRGRISVEASFEDVAETGAAVLAFLKQQWREGQ